MDDSMNSVHSISAMDISPASSPAVSMPPISSNPYILNKFHQQQELLSNLLFSTSKTVESQSPLIANDYDPQSNDLGLFSNSTFIHGRPDLKATTTTDEINQIRQRIVPDPNISTIEPITCEISKTKPNKRAYTWKLLVIIPFALLTIYSYMLHLETQIVNKQATNTWKTASEYLSQHLLGQAQGLHDLDDVMEKHNNFSIVLIQGPIGTGKTYLASSIEKFLPTTLLSINTILGLSKDYLTDPEKLTSYLLSYLTPSVFQFLIIDDLDLLPIQDTYCETLASALRALNDERNLFILLLQTKPLSDTCEQILSKILTKKIVFKHLRREEIRTCVLNEAYAQNVKPGLTDKQIEMILNSLNYVSEGDIPYATTGCKQIPSLVIIESKRI